MVKPNWWRRFAWGASPITACALFLLAGAVSLAQDEGTSGPRDHSASSESEGSAVKFRVHSDLVLVPVTVTTGKGRVVPGLAKEDFSLFEDNVPQVITHFASEDEPATIGLLFDCSDSMAGRKLARAQEAAYAILANAKPQDEFFLVRFSDRPELQVESTSDTTRIRRAVGMLRPGGFTAVLDAVKMALGEMTKAENRRKAIVLFSDGEDNHSRITPAEFQQLATESDTTIYTFFISESWEVSPMMNRPRLSGAGLLNDIAKQTGGRMFSISDLKQLPQIAARIASWIRSQYILGYVPNAENRSARFHRIQVKIAKPEGSPKLHSSWRLGYYDPAP
jgi:Ca-activated chloride channel homolog